MTAPSYVVDVTQNATTYVVAAANAGGTYSVTVSPAATVTYDVSVSNLPGVKGDRGPAGLVMRGTWSAGTAYAVDDAVFYGGSSYWAIATSTGAQPDTDGGAHWSLLAESGAIQSLTASSSINVDTTNPARPALSVVFSGGAGTACADNDARLSNARTPTAHHTTHEHGGSDELSLDAAQIATGEVDPARMGTGTRNGTKFLRDDGTWQTVGGSTTWTTPTIGSTTAATGYVPVRYGLDGSGFVHVEGSMKMSGNIVAGSTLFTLPVGMRPAATQVTAIAVDSAGAAPTFITVEIASTGAVTNKTALANFTQYGWSAVFYPG